MLTELKNVVNITTLSMTDKERMDVVERCYSKICLLYTSMIRRKTNGADGVYFTYTEEKPISFNPFYTDDYVFDVEKKLSLIHI